MIVQTKQSDTLWMVESSMDRL